MEFPIRTASAVDALDQADGDPDRYVVRAGDRSFEVTRVVVATGAFQRPFVPEFAKRLDPQIRQLHSSEYRNPMDLADGPALVVGVSHSGADIAFELASLHRTILSGKSHGQLPFRVDSRMGQLAWPVMKFVAWHLLTLSTPIGRRMASRVRDGGGPLLRVRRRDLLDAGVVWFEPRTVGVQDGQPMLADGRVLDVASVVWCTGFRPDYSWIHLPVVDADGWPRQERGVAASAPGLFFLGIPFLYGFTSMLVIGAGRDAAFIVDRIAAARMQASPKPAPGLA